MLVQLGLREITATMTKIRISGNVEILMIVEIITELMVSKANSFPR